MKRLMWLALFSSGLLANPAHQTQQVNMVLAMMETMGEFDRLSQCISLPVQRLKTLFRASFDACGVGDMNADEAEPAHQACMMQSLVSNSGVAETRWQACNHDEDEALDDPLMAELDALTERIGEREPTAAEQRQMDLLIERMQQRGVNQMEQMVAAMITGSQGSEGSISLPVYPQAQLLINLPSRGEIEIAEQTYLTLPGASFVTTASTEQVLQYYRQQLPDYQLHRPALTAATDVALMQHVPANFDYSRETGRAFSIPHIYIQPAGDNERRKLAGAKTLFFIYYQSTE